jgi:hypothetical protein
VTGNPVDVGNGFTVTSFTTLPRAPATASVNFAPEATFASQFQIGTTVKSQPPEIKSKANQIRTYLYPKPCKAMRNSNANSNAILVRAVRVGSSDGVSILYILKG